MNPEIRQAVIRGTACWSRFKAERVAVPRAAAPTATVKPSAKAPPQGPTLPWNFAVNFGVRGVRGNGADA